MQNLLQSEKYQKISQYVKNNKGKSICIFIVVLIVGYYTYGHFTATGGQITYVTGTVQTDSIVSSIAESGQVETNHQLDIKPKVSADVVYVAKSSGYFVNAGDLIAQLDTTDAEKAVRDAEANLSSANIALQKIQEPADQLTLLQAQDALTQANSDLAKAYDNGFNNVSTAFTDLPNIIAGIDTTLHNTDITTGTNQQRTLDYYSDAASQIENATNSNYGRAIKYKNDAENAYIAAKAAYDKNFSDYKNTSRTDSTDNISALVNETYATTVLVADAVKSSSNLIQYYQDLMATQSRTPVPKSTVQLNALSGYTNTINNDVNNLANAKSTIVTDVSGIPEKTASLQKIQSGADTLDIQSAQLNVTQRENALQDAKDNLADYYIRAPFSGTLSTVDVKRGDPAGTGSAIATLIASDQVANVTINEVDAAKIKLGDKATLTFDAIDGLTLTGKVATIDTVGTVSQGVVNYTATISFDSTDPRVKPGMSVTASIITATHLDVLTVPNSAVKSSNGSYYVLTFDAPLTGTPIAGTVGLPSITPPTQTPVEIGISDDTSTEIVSGLTAGQQIVTRTITPANVVATTAPSILGAATGGNRGATGGGATRALTGATRGN